MPDINEIKKIVVPIAYSYGVKRLYLFGSYAKGTASEKSDLVTTAGILCTQSYGLKNNIWALFIPYGMSVWHMFILRGSFREIPAETAKMAVTVLGGCGKQENTKPASDSGDESASSADMEEGEDEQANKPQEEADKGSTEPVSLRIVMYGDAGSRNVEFFKNEFHDKVLADTNIDMKVDLVPWGGGSDMRSCHCHH